MMPKTTRRESREAAFTLLFEWSFTDDGLDEVIENAKLARNAEIDDFALDLTRRTVIYKDELDLLIERYSQGWKLSRISKTLLAALRMSFCELTKFSDIPVGATINEAVELVKKFGTDEEAAYLNGILGSFERVRKGEKKAPPMPQKPDAEDTAEQDGAPPDSEAMSQEQPVNPVYTKQDDGLELIDDIIIEVE